MMTIYEIVNPSDAYTMVSDDAAAAGVACLFLGRGAYALLDEKDELVCPLFILGGDPDATFKSIHGQTVDEIMQTKREKVVAALRTVLIGGRAEREEFEDAISRMGTEDAEAYRAKRHDRRRTSLNDIGGKAERLAKELARLLPEPVEPLPSAG